MTKFLLRRFVKNSQHPETPAVRSAIGTMAGVTGMVCNILLFLGKLLAGLLTGSVAVVADAVNNLSDAASSVAAWLGFRLARRPADADHPYGHARYEYLSGLAVAAMILLIGAELVKTSVGKILDPEPIDFSLVTLGVLAASIAVKLWMAGFYRKLGDMIASTTLLAAAVDSRNDVIATSAVLLGCLASRFFQVDVDGYVGLAVAILILCSGVKLGKETISPLLGKQPDAALVKALTDMVLAHEKILGIHDLLVHDYGPGQCFASVHAEMPAGEDTLTCHEIIDQIEREALTQLNVHLVIHFDPVTTDDALWTQMYGAVRRIVGTLDPRLSVHDFRLERGEADTLVFDLEMPFDMQGQENRIRQAIAQALEQENTPYALQIRFDGKP
ncbi:MAG: cation diffusion facilitator family transporter [Firmicutes bacterium]|nr:cation diffusion facilitator family transporter [Bacillota bacterium]